MSTRSELEARAAELRQMLATIEVRATSLRDQLAATDAELDTVVAELERVEELLDALPLEWDPAALHRPLDQAVGVRVNSLDAPGRLATMTKRLGVPVRTAVVFEGATPLTKGTWPKLATVLEACPDTLVVATWNTGDGSNARGKGATAAQIRAGFATLRRFAAGASDPQLVRALEARRRLGHVDQIVDRFDHEHNGYPYDWANGILGATALPAALELELALEGADAYRAAWEHLLEVAADVLGPDYARTRWSWNLAGGATGRPGAADLIRRAWPRNVPTGTRLGLTLDHYFRDLGSLANLTTALAVVDQMAAELGAAFVGIDETGGHLPDDPMSPAQAAKFRQAATTYAETMFRWAAGRPDLSHLAPFETDTPNGGRDLYTRVVLDPEARGPLARTVTGADGATFTSNYPEVFTAWRAALTS